MNSTNLSSLPKSVHMGHRWSSVFCYGLYYHKINDLSLQKYFHGILITTENRIHLLMIWSDLKASMSKNLHDLVSSPFDQVLEITWAFWLTIMTKSKQPARHRLICHVSELFSYLLSLIFTRINSQYYFHLLYSSELWSSMHFRLHAHVDKIYN